MTDPNLPNSPATLHARHLRSVAGLVGMALAVGGAVAIQVGRSAHDAALLAKGCSVATVALPTTWLQLTYSLAIPVGLPLALFVCSLMLFSPTVFGQLVSLLPWRKTTP